MNVTRTGKFKKAIAKRRKTIVLGNSSDVVKGVKKKQGTKQRQNKKKKEGKRARGFGELDDSE